MLPLLTLRRGVTCLMLAAFAMLLAGCERAVPTLDYMPMRDGNRWEYRLLDRSLLQTVEQGVEVQTELAASSVREEELIGTLPPRAEVVAPEGEAPSAPAQPTPAGAAKKARRVVLELKEAINELTYRAKYDQYEQVWSKSGGYVSFQNAKGRHYLLILPAHSTYRWVVTDPSGENLYYEVEPHAEVTTPAGTFHGCAVAREETRDRRVMYRYWFAPGVGLVRRSKYFVGEEVFRQELVTHAVQPSTRESRSAEELEIRDAQRGKKRGTEHLKGGPRPIEPAEFPGDEK